MPTHKFLQFRTQMIEKEQKINKLHEMIAHWNDCNLNGIAAVLSNQVELKTPPVKIGPILLTERELKGIHHVLKFWKELFEKYSFGCKNFKIIDITGNIITTVVDYPEIKVSAKCNFQFSKTGQIKAIDIYKVLELGLDKEAKTLPLMLRLVENRIKTKFGK